MAAMPEKRTMLDIGCGTGSLLLRAAGEGKVSTGLGIDVFDPALALARTAWEAQRSACLDVSLQFRKHVSPAELDGTWETVVMIDVIHHVPVPDQEHDE